MLRFGFAYFIELENGLVNFETVCFNKFLNVGHTPFSA